jgi:hypothetical protein
VGYDHRWDGRIEVSSSGLPLVRPWRPFPEKPQVNRHIEYLDPTARRTAVERSYSTVKDPASTDISRGWCRVMGLGPMALFLVCAVVVRNMRVVDAFTARQADEERRRAAGLEPRTRRRRRRSIDDLLAAAAPPP